MQFLVTAYDASDAKAEERRLAAREAHLESVKELKARGNFIEGGAILDDQDRMIGSTLYMEFPSRMEFDEWLRNDPYTTGGVWVDVRVDNIRLALRS